VLAALVIVAALVLPVVAQVGINNGLGVSLSNLGAIGVAQATYAADYGGRQVTYVYDEISALGDTPGDAFPEYLEVFGEDHPPLILGWGLVNGDGPLILFAYRPTNNCANATLLLPIAFDGQNCNPALTYFGAFRMMNTRPLHDYVDGRFYDPTFYPPNDTVVYDVVEPAFDSPWEYVDTLVGCDAVGDIPAWASYCPSPAAMFHPDVMRPEPEGGWQDPWSLDLGFQTPGLYQATYPDLKTFVIEHHWNQNRPPDICNPGFEPGTYGAACCEPYYFNHGLASAPATLFYDLSTRLLPNREVMTADTEVMKQTGFGLWSRDTPFGVDGYFNEYSYDGVELSHHILTTDGILGRDTTAGADSIAER